MTKYKPTKRITYTFTIEYAPPTPDPNTVTEILMMSQAESAGLGYRTNVKIDYENELTGINTREMAK
jgi:hypothetical protein